MHREEIRFVADIIAHPLSTTVNRYQRLNLSRRRGNAIRQHMVTAGITESVTIPTRSGQVVLYQLTEAGRALCDEQGIDPGPRPRAGLEHTYWVDRTRDDFERKGYTVRSEHVIRGNGAIDLLAERPGQRVAVEIETGKSDIQPNLKKIQAAGFDRIVLVATSPSAITACQAAMAQTKILAELLTWLDIS